MAEIERNDTDQSVTAQQRVQWRIDPQKRIVYLTFLENPTLLEVMSILSEIFAHPDYQSDYGFLADRRKVGPPTTDYMKGATEVARHHKAQLQGPWATVVTGLTSYGMARMGEILAEPIGIQERVFTDLAEAEVWLTGKRPS